LVGLDHNPQDEKDDSVICAALPTNYHATNQSDLLLLKHTASKWVENGSLGGIKEK